MSDFFISSIGISLDIIGSAIAIQGRKIANGLCQFEGYFNTTFGKLSKKISRKYLSVEKFYAEV